MKRKGDILLNGVENTKHFFDLKLCLTTFQYESCADIERRISNRKTKLEHECNTYANINTMLSDYDNREFESLISSLMECRETIKTLRENIKDLENEHIIYHDKVTSFDLNDIRFLNPKAIRASVIMIDAP